MRIDRLRVSKSKEFERLEFTLYPGYSLAVGRNGVVGGSTIY
jgi:hypothetical protein